MKSQIDVIDVNGKPAAKRKKPETGEEIGLKERERIREKKRRMRQRARRRQRIRLVISASALVLALLVAGHFLRNEINGGGTAAAGAYNTAENSENTDGSGNTEETGKSGIHQLEDENTDAAAALKYEVGTPQVLEGEAITERLNELAQDYTEFEEICANQSLYPENLLAALCNNPEMIDFVKGYLTAGQTAFGGLTEEEKQQEHPHFLQWDTRWGYTTYGEDILALSGCGPTCLSMVVVALTDNKDASPDVIASYAMEHDFYMMGTGTMWKLMTEGAEQFGLASEELETDETAMKQCLDNGGMLIATMAPGDFTAVGHFIVIYGYDEEGFFVNDPNCLARSQKKWNFTTLAGQIKKVWGLSRALG